MPWKRVTQGLVESVRSGSYVSLIVPPISPAGSFLPSAPPVRIAARGGGSDPTLLTTNWGWELSPAALASAIAVNSGTEKFTLPWTPCACNEGIAAPTAIAPAAVGV